MFVKGLNRWFKDTGKQVFWQVFTFGQRLGFDILPRHFYSSIPDVKELRNSDSWRHPLSMTGIAGVDLESQLTFVADCCEGTIEYSNGVYQHAIEENGEGGYGPIEAEFLFCFVAKHRPRKIIQVGAGVSTSIILKASLGVGHRPEILCIDPHPNAFLQLAAASNRIQLITERAQDVDLEILTSLEAGDLLFVDSTHAVKAGSEVNRIILEILPRLNPGCFVHFHDIYFPFDYGPSLLHTTFFWNESTLLYAFLVGNSRFAIVTSLSMLHHCRSRELQAILPNYRPAPMRDGLYTSRQTEHFPNSLYLRVT